MPWVQLAIAAVFFVIGELLRPKPKFEDAQATPFDEARLPSLDPERKQAVIYGRVDIRAPQVMDVTEYTPLPITQKVKTSIFSSKRITVGFRYFVGMQLGLVAKATVMHKIWYDERELWSGTAAHADAGTAVTLNLPEFLGGKEKGGGIIGTFRFYGGSLTQQVNTYLATFQTPCPAYRWTSMVVMENVEVGEISILSGFGFQLSYYPNPLGLSAGNNGIGVDLNPMSILVDLLTNKDYGFGLSLADDIDSASFTTAAVTLASEANGMSFKWTQNESVETIIQTINRQADGVMRYNPQTGKWEYKLVRDDYVVANLHLFNEDNIIELTNYSRASWDETINQVQINYSQLDSLEEPSPAMADDRSNFVRQGRSKIQSSTFPGVYSATLAAKIAGRELFKGAFPLATVEIIVNRDGWDLLPGDTFRLSWPELGIDQQVYRIASIGFGDDTSLEIQINAIEDIFKLSAAIFSTPPASMYTPIAGAPLQIVTQHAIDTPYLFSKLDELTTNPGTAHKPLSMAAAPQNNSQNYTLYARPGSSPYIPESTADFLPTGTLSAALIETTVDTITSMVINSVSRAALISTAALTGAEIKASKNNLILIQHATLESEFMAYEDASVSGTTVTLTNVHRAVLDTLATAHPINARVWFLTGVTIPGPGTTLTEYTSAAVVNTQMENNTQLGVGTKSAALTVTMRNRVNRPYPGRNFKVNSVRYPLIAQSLGAAILFSFDHGARTENDLWFQDDSVVGSSTKESGYEYVMRIYNNVGLVLLRTIKASGGTDTWTVDSPGVAVSYNYTLAKQETDGGPFSVYRVELTVQDTATGLVKSVLDVIRVFQVTIPVSLIARGPIYQSYNQGSPTFSYPLNQFAPPHKGIGASAVDATEVGNTGNSGPGPDGLSYNIYTLGTVGNNVVIPHASTTLLNSRCVHLMFKIAADAQGDRALIIKDDADGGTARSYALVISGTGLLRGDLSSTNSPAQGGAPVLNFEDGKWHQLLWIKYSGDGNALFVDGNLVNDDRVSTTTAPPTNTADLRVGAALTGTQLGYAKAFFAHLAFWTTTDIPTTSEIQSMFANALLPSYTRGRQTLSYPGLRLFVRGNVGDIASGNLFLDLSESTTGHNNDWVPLIGTDNLISTTNTVQASGASQRAMDVEDDPGYRALYLVNGSFEIHIIAPRNHFNGGTNAGVGAREFTFITTVKPDAAPAQPVGLFYVGGGSEEVAQNVFSIRIETGGKIRVHMSLSSGNSRTWETTNVAIPTFGGIWYDIVVTNKTTDGKKIYVNGVSWAITESTAGTPPASDDWINNRGADTAAKSSYLTNSPTNSQRSKLEFGEWAYIENLALTAGEVVLNWLNIKRGFPRFEDELLWSHPENMFQVLDYATTADKRGAITGTATVTGTLPTDEEVGIPSDDYTKPARFSTTQRLRYTSAQFLASKGTGAIHDFTAMIVGMSQAAGVSGTHFCNGPTGGASTNRNLDFYFNNTNARVDFRTSDATLGVGPTRSHFDSYCIFMREKTAGGNFHEYWDDVVRNSSASTATTYTGSACVEANIGAQGGLTVPLNGQTHYAAAWAEYISTRLIKKIQLRYRGLVGGVLEIHSHINQATPDSVLGWIFPLDDLSTIAFHENHVVNDASSIQNLTKNGSPTRVRSPVVYGKTHATKFLSASNQYSEGVCRFTSPPAAISWGGMFRVDSGTNAWAGFGTQSAVDTDRYFMVGIIGLRAGIKFSLNDSTDRVETGATVLVVGTWYHIVCVRTSDILREVYLNGVLEATFTVSRNWTSVSGMDITSVNRIPGPETLADGTYSSYFGVAKAFTAAEIREIHAAHLQDGSWQATRALAATAFWPLSDSENPALKFHDRVNGTYNATGTGMTERAAGIIPNRPGNCVDFDGSGQIDTNWLGYPTGAAVRSFSVWLEAGFVGTVFSLGANTDAESLVVSIDGSGDVSINIRGAGNLRKYTSSFDGAGVRHLCVVQTVNSLHDFKVYQDGVDQTGIGTAGTDTTLATTATLDLHLGKDITDIATADGDGKMSGFSVYATALSADQALQLYQAGATKKQGVS